MSEVTSSGNGATMRAAVRAGRLFFFFESLSQIQCGLLERTAGRAARNIRSAVGGKWRDLVGRGRRDSGVGIRGSAELCFSV